MRVLITGGAGFIGSNFIHLLLSSRRAAEVVNLDKLTYSGNLENLAAVAEDRRYSFVHGDIADPALLKNVLARGFDAIINFAAETHVDRSIEDAAPFLHTNVLGTHALLEAARQNGIAKFVQISTDEVYGSAPADVSFDERAPLNPASPYSASKIAGDHLVNAYAITYGLPAVILRCTNNYGPYQFPEKLMPLMIANALEDKPLPVYGDGLHERDWLYVEDFCRAILCALEAGATGEIYNVSAGTPRPNLLIVRTILQQLGKPESLIQFVKDRPGHDRRYALDSTKLQKTLGWKPQVSFEEGILRTVRWYRDNPGWLQRTRSGDYRLYYERHYARREETFKTVGGR
ncbi:MAG: dTDP-glucose 4,6-dehydratase [Terriglobales bacterium]